MATGDNVNASGEGMNIKCCICAEKYIARQADTYCVECHTYYCRACTDAHRIFPTLHGHKLMDNANCSTAGLQSIVPGFPLEKCSAHSDKLLDCSTAGLQSTVPDFSLERCSTHSDKLLDCSTAGIQSIMPGFSLERCSAHSDKLLDCSTAGLQSIMPGFPLERCSAHSDKLLDCSTAGLQSIVPGFLLERCLTHRDQLLDIFCGNHDEMVCVRCIPLYHRTCRNIHAIPGDVDNLYKKSATEETQRQLSTTKVNLERIKKVKENQAEELNQSLRKATDCIKDTMKEMAALLEKLAKQSIKAVEKVYGIIEADLQQAVADAENYIDDLEKFADILKKSEGNKTHEFVCVKTAEKHIAKAKGAGKLLEKSTYIGIEFVADSNIKTFLHQQKTLGKVSAETNKHCKLKTTPYKVKQEKEIDVKLRYDAFTCNIFGSCLTEDGSLLLADFNNNKLKRVNLSTETVRDYLNMPGSPIAICQTSNNEAAVSLESDKSTIQFVSIGEKMTCTRQLNLGHYCYGLAYKDEKIVITEKSNAIYIHSMAGVVLHKTTADKSGKVICKNNRHISLGTNRDRVYVADQKSGLVTLDSKGNQLLTFTDIDLVKPQGVCTDGRGNIFACGFGSTSIVQISEDSQRKLGMFGTLTNPLSLCFDPYQNRLVVTQFEKNSIKIIQLE